MCNHVYTADQKSWPRLIGKSCPYPDFYAKVTAAGAGEPGSFAELPLDRHGACIFHSLEIDWKRANGLREKFLELVRLLDAYGPDRHYDFAEFVFVGDEVATPKGPRENLFRIANLTFRKQALFLAARFLDMVELEGVDFQRGAEFRGATFSRKLAVRDSRIHGAGMEDVDFAPAWFIRVDFDDYALFTRSRFTGALGGGYAVHFQDSRFGALTDFSSAEFDLGDGTVFFERVRFEFVTDFSGARFRCHAKFGDVVFTNVADFIDTSFGLVRSAARYHGAAAQFSKITVTDTGVVTFLSSDPEKKLFDHDVEMTFREEPTGLVRFENASLARFTPQSRERLMELARIGRVEIGPGCIKYRLQTGVRTVPVEPENAPLVVEICQTFTSYFMASHGLNLGFEIVARDRVKISFFYFTDEDISYEVFLERLAQTERSLWNLLSIGSNEQLLALAARGQTADARGESVLINAVDGLSALVGTFLRVGVRITLGRWKAVDTLALLSAIRFNDEGAELRASSLHHTLMDRYTGAALVELNRRQNELLPPIAAAGRSPLANGKVGILFLGANSAGSPLDLEREVSRISMRLKLARERDLELKQEWAVTIDTLMQAMLDEQPTIVHFSGHGTESGIILRDEVGRPRSVSGEALANLFELFKDTVRCVVLNSCYSEVQATAIRRHIPFVIGMRSAIADVAAVAFSTGFYTAVGAGKEIPFAFEMGKARVRLEGAGGEDLLTLL